MRNFRELEIWKEARKLVKDVYLATKLLPDTEKYGLISQINRCSVSIAANIAEGCAKYSNKDFVRFLQISLGSAYELENHLILCEDLEFIIPEQASPIIKKVQRLQKRIASLIKYNKQNLWPFTLHLIVRSFSVGQPFTLHPSPFTLHPPKTIVNKI